MGKILSGLIVFAVIAGAIIALLAGTALSEQAKLDAEQARRHAEELHQVQMQVQREEATQAVIQARQLAPVKTAATGLVFFGGASALVGAGWYLVQEFKKRTLLIYPNDAGIFPQVTVELPNGAKAYHDPNRSPTHITVYSQTADGGVQISPVQLPGIEDSVRQAAAVQLTRAAVSGGAQLTEDAERVARRFLPGDDDADRAPVRVLESAAGNVDKLLEADDGDA